MSSKPTVGSKIASLHCHRMMFQAGLEKSGPQDSKTKLDCPAPKSHKARDNLSSVINGQSKQQLDFLYIFQACLNARQRSLPIVMDILEKRKRRQSREKVRRRIHSVMRKIDQVAKMSNSNAHFSMKFNGNFYTYAKGNRPSEQEIVSSTVWPNKSVAETLGRALQPSSIQRPSGLQVQAFTSRGQRA